MRLVPSLDAVDPFDVEELGLRAALGLHGENRGLPLRQRVPVITGRKPPRMAWFINWGEDGYASSMTAGYRDEGAW